jgi:prevent-host-death family protein
MTETEVGIRELKAHLSKYLRRVREGYSVLITDRGKPIGRIVPAEQPLADRLRVMVDTGALLWSGRPLVLAEPVANISGDRTIADLLIEDRE